VSAAVALARLLLGGIFLYAAGTKLPDMAAFADSIANYRILPAALVPTAASVLVGTEIVIGLALLTGWGARAASWLAALLLAVFTVGLSAALVRGIDLACGCFGGNDPATWWTVARDVAWLALALLVALRGPGRLSPERTPAPAA
jgi:putative oxidoreductase